MDRAPWSPGEATPWSSEAARAGPTMPGRSAQTTSWSQQAQRRNPRRARGAAVAFVGNSFRESRLEQADDLTVRIDVDVLAARPGWQTGHRPHLARERRDEPRPGRPPTLTDGDAEAARPALQGRVPAPRRLR